MEVVPKKFKYKQKKDNRGSTIEGVYTLVCLGRRRAWLGFVSALPAFVCKELSAAC